MVLIKDNKMKLESICISLTFIEGIAIWLIVESEKSPYYVYIIHA